MGADSATNSSNLWARIGAVDGLKYLSKHFQIVIYNKDTFYEDHQIGKGGVAQYTENGMAPFYQINSI